MARSLPAGFQTALTNHEAGSELALGVFVELEFDGTPLYVHSGIKDVVWDSKTWKGVGALGSISSAKEDTQMRDARLTVSLSHIPIASMPDLIDEVEANDPIGRPATIYIAALDAGGGVVEAIPSMVGFIDEAWVEEGDGFLSEGREGQVKITIVSEAARFNWTHKVLMTDEAQKRIFPTDKGLEFVGDGKLSELHWGAANPQKVNTASTPVNNEGHSNRGAM